jgi:hypothetical protein
MSERSRSGPSGQQFTIERVRVLNGHTDADSAYLVDDYPYGRTLRCRRRTWIETATKGRCKGMQRFVAQTTDPKKPTEVWNKPHASTYDLFMLMYLNKEDHVQFWNVGWGVTPSGDAQMRLMGMYDQMTDEYRAIYDALLARSRRYEEPWQTWVEVVEALASYIKETGSEPEVRAGYWEGPTGRYYLGANPTPYILTAQQEARKNAIPARNTV